MQQDGNDGNVTPKIVQDENMGEQATGSDTNPMRDMPTSFAPMTPDADMDDKSQGEGDDKMEEILEIKDLFWLGRILFIFIF